MASQEQLRTITLKWTADGDDLRAEARRLELSDLSRHATSIAMLEARAQAIVSMHPPDRFTGQALGGAPLPS